SDTRPRAASSDDSREQAHHPTQPHEQPAAVPRSHVLVVDDEPQQLAAAPTRPSSQLRVPTAIQVHAWLLLPRMPAVGHVLLLHERLAVRPESFASEPGSGLEYWR